MDIMALINKYSKLYGVERELITAIIDRESSFDSQAVNKNDPSYGLMQIMVPTSNQFGPYTASDLMDPETNIKVGTQYIKYLQTIFTDVRDVISGYNAGPNGVTRPYKNPDYVSKVYGKYMLLRILNDLNCLMPFMIPIGILSAFLLLPPAKDIKK